ncbi:MAG: ATP-binding protein, partial [Anaerolineaceae bacterium]|nr:ATP-binding protein [Anaerolineaceae bacterium]
MSNMNKFTFETSGGQPIGYVVGGGLKANLFVRLTVPSDQVQEGGFVVLESGNWQFYGLVTDLQLGASDPRYAEKPAENRLSPSITRLLNEQTLYTNLEVLPALMLERGPELDSPDYEDWTKAHQNENLPRPLPIKTVPSHHSLARLASAGDVAEIFGEPGQKGFFEIGKTREQDHPVCINLDKFVQRSAGIFGATGSGKSFLTRIILAGLIEHNAASVLVFDMHNEYGFDSTSSDTGQAVAGLRGKFNQRVRVVGLGRKSTILNKTPDLFLEFSESDIQPEDIEMLSRELDLRDTSSTTLDTLIHSFGRENWFSEFRKLKSDSNPDDEKSVANWAAKVGANPAAVEGLRRKLNRVYNCDYIISNDDQNRSTSSLKNIVEALKAGQHVILSFGDYQKDLDYLLVSNLLTRKIRDEWQSMT